MIIPKNLYKRLLITSEDCSIDKMKQPISPSVLLTGFERWSGKRKKLYFRSNNEITSKVSNFNLRENIFANILSSPMRLDKVSRVKLPKELLIQLNITKHHTISTKKPLKLSAAVQNVGEGKSSYVLNNYKELSKLFKSAASWLPIPSSSSSNNYFNISDVHIDQNLLTEYKELLLKTVSDGLLGCVNTSNGSDNLQNLGLKEHVERAQASKLSRPEKNEFETGIKTLAKQENQTSQCQTEILITYEEGNKDAIYLKKQTDETKNGMLTVFNLGSTGTPELKKIATNLRLDKAPIVLNRMYNKDLIKNIFKMLSFFLN
ncbi:Rrg8p NDAI_0A04700 [Naumovozyma dairenensis CBS 421]|uniref:Required for respiratory growth protein 8, mitochondrial n=1 Tax=Naumovozyma dairenensis (strain ATCC 10597 / BCRC 20456 / CBS 421 / NBRC 0211 / NRRL Y-12639) TaxID=1071378 RepID=G0W488_NAUDC|nr:hypothetical protein NDAI_0A04700 [Naumovozyma dairenensis CBS 421]CCD22626.1 hypothetical protein NDAI_0A04700 [Naumovozyma dairenensis CBS 421]